MLAAAGPPWTTVIIGTFLPGSASRALSSHPCTVNPSLVQLTLWAFTTGAIDSLSCVIWRGADTGPAKIAGACSKSSTTDATTAPFALNATRPSAADRLAARRHKGVALPSVESAVTCIVSPASAVVWRPSLSQNSDVLVVFDPLVMSTGVPPAKGTV